METTSHSQERGGRWSIQTARCCCWEGVSPYNSKPQDEDRRFHTWLHIVLPTHIKALKLRAHTGPSQLCKDTPTQSLKACKSPPVSYNSPKKRVIWNNQQTLCSIKNEINVSVVLFLLVMSQCVVKKWFKISWSCQCSLSLSHSDVRTVC